MASASLNVSTHMFGKKIDTRVLNKRVERPMLNPSSTPPTLKHMKPPHADEPDVASKVWNGHAAYCHSCPGKLRARQEQLMVAEQLIMATLAEVPRPVSEIDTSFCWCRYTGKLWVLGPAELTLIQN